MNAKIRAFVAPPVDSTYLHLINYGKPTSTDFQELDHKYELTAPPRRDLRTGHWEAVVDTAILTDLSHAIYGERKWTGTDLFTHAHGKYVDDMRRTAVYLDYIEQDVVNILASENVYSAFENAKLQPDDSTTEPLCEIFDLAINFIIYLAVNFQDSGQQLTSSAFHDFQQSYPAYQHGESPIFKQDAPQAMNFLMMTYRLGMSYDVSTPYFGGHELHLYMGSRRRFGKIREHSIRAELLQALGLAADENDQR